RGTMTSRAVFCLAVVFVSSLSMQAQQTRTVRDGVYTDAQATRGAAIYKEKCASCHGPTLGGSLAPPLAGDAFAANWGGPLSAIVDKIQATMPANAMGTLTRAQASDVLAFMLQTSKFPAGRAELSSDEAALKAISLPGAQPPAIRTVANGATPVFPPAGNMAQLMRGVLFPSANMIFNVQRYDPATPPKANNQSKEAGFSWVDWGAGVYTGWEIVDYAAVALGETAPLMLTPGRRCENGKPVPVNDPEWIKFSTELYETSKAVYAAAQTRNQEKVSDITERLADMCLHCHQVYRDKRIGRTPDDPQNRAARCSK
ncbi:MAG TPA: cytochrome c, partial [Vicinamibacterales bacterium]|nr:cytochrome c [Vicinamibacterales bacterium]